MHLPCELPEEITGNQQGCPGIVRLTPLRGRIGN